MYVYSGYGIASDGKDEWSFNNYTARNVIVFGVDNKSSSHSDNLKNDFSFSVKVQLLVLMEILILLLLKQKQSFVRVCIIMLIIVTYL